MRPSFRSSDPRSVNEKVSLWRTRSISPKKSRRALQKLSPTKVRPTRALENWLPTWRGIQKVVMPPLGSTTFYTQEATTRACVRACARVASKYPFAKLMEIAESVPTGRVRATRDNFVACRTRCRFLCVHTHRHQNN